MAKRFIIGVSVKNRPVHFRLDAGEDVFLLNEESLNVLKKAKLSKVIGRLRNASKRLTKFKGFHIIARGHVLWHENTGVFHVRYGAGICSEWTWLGKQGCRMYVGRFSREFGQSNASYSCYEGSCGSK